jgi:hypothetical protein
MSDATAPISIHTRRLGGVAGVLLAVVTLTGCGADTTDAPAAAPTVTAPTVTTSVTATSSPALITFTSPPVTVTLPAKTVRAAPVTVTKTVTKTVRVKSAAAPAAPAGDSCAAAREAILTGSKSDITRAMKGLVADKSADSVAREYARYYLGRDADNPQMREMDISLIQMSCS